MFGIEKWGPKPEGWAPSNEKLRLVVLLIRRGKEKEPYHDTWALPGGFINMEETLEESVRRELEEETGLNLPIAFLKQLQTFGDPGRDPRGRVISTTFLALVNPVAVKGGDDAKEAKWFPIDELPPLAFDHEKILACGRKHLNGYALGPDLPIGALLPEEFTLSEMQTVCETILGRLDKRNFRQRAATDRLVEDTGTYTDKGVGRPAKIYRIAKPPSAE